MQKLLSGSKAKGWEVKLGFTVEDLDFRVWGFYVGFGPHPGILTGA